MKIPEYQQSVSPQTVTVPKQGLPNPVEAAFGGQVAQAITGLGETGTKLAGALQAHIVERQKQKDDADLNNYDSEFIDFTKDALWSTAEEKVKDGETEYVRPAGLLNQELGATTGGTVAWRSKAIPKMKELISKGRTPEQQEKIKQRLMSTYNGADESVLRHEARQGHLSRVQAVEANQLKRQSEAALIHTPDSLVNAIQISNENSDQLSSLKSLDKASSDIARKTDAAKMVEASATAVLMGPGGIESAMAQIEAAKDYMLPDTYKDMQASITTKWNTLESARYTREDRNRTSIKMSLVRLGTTGKLTMSDYYKAAEAGAFETPQEAENYKKLAVGGVSITATTDAAKYKTLFDEMLTLAEPNAVLKENQRFTEKGALVKPRSNVTPVSVIQFQSKVLQANRDGVISQSDAERLVSATEKIFDMTTREEVNKERSAREFWSGAANFFTPGIDIFDKYVEERKVEYRKKYIEDVFFGGKSPSESIKELTKMNLEEHPNENFRKFAGQEPGKFETTLSDGKKYRLIGFYPDGEPNIEEVK